MTMLELLQLTERLALCEELLLGCFRQGATVWDRNMEKWDYDHMCLSAYEKAQDYLIEHGLIKKEDCTRK